MKNFFLTFLLLFNALLLFSQVATFDSTGLKIIKITHADSVIGYNETDKKYQRLLGAVSIEHDGVFLTCDSAHLFQEQNMVEAFSNVHITKTNGTNANSNYIKYTGNNNTAFMQGAVQIIDGNNTLNTEELTYNIKTKIGRYEKHGTLQNEETTVTSDIGTYNGFTQQAYFVKEVTITNPKYTINSKELTYNTKTKIVKFLDESDITTEKSTIKTTSGTYNSKTSNATFTSRTTIENEDQVIVGDYITYEDNSGSAFAKGKVIVIDVKNNSTVYSDMAEYNKKTGNGSATGHVFIVREDGKNTLDADNVEYNKKNGYVKATATDDVVLLDTLERTKLLAHQVEFNENAAFMLATKNPRLVTVNDSDSLFMRADTIMSMRIKDKNDLKKIIVSTNKKTKETIYSYNLLYADSTYKSNDDSTEPKLIIANQLVKLFSDSMQAVCDSLSYSQQDSVFRLFKAPILWSKNQQANADTIFAHTINNKLTEANLIANALVVSMTGFETFYDQVAGHYIDAFFEHNDIQKIDVNQNAESLYYAKDEANAYIGLNKTESSSLHVFFDDAKELDHIVWNEEPKGGMIPIDKMVEDNKFLSSFKLLTDKKPKNKEEVMNNK